MIGGSGLHAAGKHYWVKSLLGEKELPGVEELQQVAVDKFEERHELEGVSLKAKEKEDGEEKTISATKDTMVKLVECYHDEVIPNIGKPLAVEKRIDIEIPETGYSLVGILDLCHVSPIPGLGDVEIIEDLKWAAKKKNQSEVDRNRQLTFYAWGWQHLNDRLPGAVGLRVIKPLKKGPVADPLLWSTRTEKDIERLFRVISYVGKSITAGVFPPADSDFSWWCTPDGCGHWDHCRFTGGE